MAGASESPISAGVLETKTYMYFPNKTASLTSLFNETSVTLIYGTI
jgi:hypothetical protein